MFGIEDKMKRYRKLLLVDLKEKKGSVLVLSFMTFAILFVVGQAFLSRTFSDMKLSENALSQAQAFYLAEGAKNATLAELRQRTTTHIDQRVRGVSDIASLQSYLPISRSLEFLRDYAYAGSGDARFALDNPGWGDRAYLVISSPNAVTGSYTTLLEVFTNGTPSIPFPGVFVFFYRYQISSIGTATRGGMQQFVQATGTFTITVQRDNFARYALFTDTHTAPSGTIVWFTNLTTFRGPVHSNDRFSFANNPSGTFTDGVSQRQQTARFYNNGNAILLDADRNGNRDVPQFQNGFTRSVNRIPLPSMTVRDDQKRVALGLNPNERIPNMSNGIYLPADGTTLKGGIYVQGDAHVTLTMDQESHQRYTVRQGSTTKEITVKPETATTVVRTGNTTETYTGTPRGILYTAGAVQSLSGTVSNQTQVTIATENDLLINQHLRYQNYSTTPTLNASGQRNLLGLLSWNGNVRITPSAPDNLEIHGTLMTPNGVVTVDNYSQGNPRGTVTLLGGVIENQYGAFGTFQGTQQRSGYGRNFVYDGRMLQGQSPPYFPTITLFTAVNNGVRNLPAWDRKRGHAPP